MLTLPFVGLKKTVLFEALVFSMSWRFILLECTKPVFFFNVVQFKSQFRCFPVSVCRANDSLFCLELFTCAVFNANKF